MEEGGKVWLLVFSPNKDNAFLAKMNLLYDTELYDIYEVLDEDGKHFPPSHQQRRHRKRISLLRSFCPTLACTIPMEEGEGLLQGVAPRVPTKSGQHNPCQNEITL